MILPKSVREEQPKSMHTDELTGLPKLASLEKFVTDKNRYGYSVISLKVLRFKDANTLYGRAFGDYVICEIASHLKKLATCDYKFVRGYGCNFYIVYNSVNESEIKTLAALIKNRVDKVYKVGSRHFKVESALCAFKVFTTNIAFDTLMRDLDIAMCKSLNSNALVTFATTRLISTSISDLRLQQKLISAIEEKKIDVLYQPQVDHDGNVSGLEALARWEDEELGNIPADKFISMAEAVGVINELGRVIAFKSLSDFAKVRLRFKRDISLSINISISQLLDDDFTSSFLDMLAKFNLPSSIVTIEITESSYISQMEKIVTVLSYLRYKGFKVSLDDFGAGHANVDLLSVLPIDELKVDKSIVAKISQSEQHLSMLKGILGLSEKYGMSVVVEGVESRSQEILLKELGCKFFQGYFYGKPERIDNMFSTSRS